MNFDKISDERLFINNTKEEIMHWCRGLDYFHYMRARGGHNCEGDSFCVYFDHSSKEDLIAKLAKLGIGLQTLEEGFIAFDPFESYDLEDLDKLKITIAEYPDLIQPQYVHILGYKVHIWVLNDKIEISVSGSKDGLMYKVSDIDFGICQILEKEFERLGWQSILNMDIENQIHCISKVRYPELYL